MELFDYEYLVTESDNKQLILTSHRVRYHETTSKNSNFTTIMVDKISSIELTYQSEFWVLLLGIITIPVVIGIVLIIIYYMTRKHVVSITPDGGKPIIFETQGMKREFLENFINKVENAAIVIKGKN